MKIFTDGVSVEKACVNSGRLLIADEKWAEISTACVS